MLALNHRIKIAVQEDQRKYIEENWTEYKWIGYEFIKAQNTETDKIMKLKIAVYEVLWSRLLEGVPGGFWTWNDNPQFWKRLNIAPGA